MIRCEWSFCQEKDSKILETSLTVIVQDRPDCSHTFHPRCARLYYVHRRCKEQRFLN